MMTNLDVWQMVIDCEREIALRRADRLGPLVSGTAIDSRRRQSSMRGDQVVVTRRPFLRPMLRLIGLR